MKIGLLIAAAIGILYAAFAATGVPVPDALREIITGSLGNERAISGTLREFMPLLLAGVAVSIALQAGLFNIGVEGQLLVGALACAVAAYAVGGPFGVIVGALAGMLGGALWAFPAGWIKAFRGGHEVIVTIMLNNVAGLFANALVSGPLRAPGQESPTTATLTATTRLPNLMDTGKLQVNASLLLAILAVIAYTWWLKRTVAGFELRAVGANPVAAKAAGVDVPKATVRAMLASGAIAGLAGSLMVLSFEGRFYQGFSAGYGFDALGVALLAGSATWGLLPGAFLFAILAKGGTAVQILGVPKGVTYVLLGLLIIIVAALRYRKGGRSDA